MIKVPFLHYKTLQGFQADLAQYGESAFNKKIVFIKDKSLIWTHRNYYGVSPQMLSDIETRLRNIEYIISDEHSVQEITQKFQEIQEFLDSIEDTELLDIISTIRRAVQTEEDRARIVENRLSDRIDDVEDRIYAAEQWIGHTVEVKHIVLEEDEYKALTEYEPNAIYFVLEPKDTNTWVFGDEFPITLI